MIRNAAAALLAAFALGVPAYAATYSYSASSTNVVLNPGQTTIVSLFVTETTDGVEPSLFATESGLNSADVRVQQVSSTATTSTTVLDVLDVSIAAPFAPPFIPPDIEITGTTIDIAAFADIGATEGPSGTVDGNTRSVKIADVTFTAGTEGVTVVELVDDPRLDTNLTFLATSFDSLLPTSNGPTITFTVLPEPASAGALAGLAMLLGRRRLVRD